MKAGIAHKKSKHSIGDNQKFIHHTNKYTFNIYKYSFTLLLHVSSFSPSSGSPTPRFKTYNFTDYKSNSGYHKL